MRNLLPLFIQEQYQKQVLSGEFDAATLFVDVSGFTAMTQTLMSHGHEGAEVLATVMNDVFDSVIAPVYQWGGFISVFAGDAFTAIFPANATLSINTVVLHTFAALEKIQTIFLRQALQTTPFGQFTLQFKVGVSAGSVTWGILGQTTHAYFFRGEAVDACAAAEHHANKGDLIFDERFGRLLRSAPEFAGTSWNVEVVQRGFYRLQSFPKILGQIVKKPKLPKKKALSAKVAARFLPPEVVEFHDIGEFRQVVVLFISFDGLKTLQELDAWTELVLKHIHGLGGYFVQLDFGDKGGTMLCGFGAPVTHEKMADRALNCLLSVQTDISAYPLLANLQFRAGITSGIAYAGIAGGVQRCVYTYYGEIVNLSARLMMHAAWGEILTAETVYRKARARFTFASVGDVSYKGFANPIATYRFIGPKFGLANTGFKGQMIGRQAELDRLTAFVAPIFAGQCAGVAYIYGEAGIGKSRLAYALEETLRAQSDLYWFRCPVDQVVRKPLNPFITFFRHYFEQIAGAPESANNAKFEEKYAALITRLSALSRNDVLQIQSELLRTQSIIAALIGHFLPESLWEQLDAKGKYENTLQAIKTFFLAQSLLKPVIIEIEDGHWLDSDSFACLQQLTHHIAGYPFGICATLRYQDDGAKTTFQLAGVPECQIDLRYLLPEEVKCYAEAELQGAISAPLHELLLTKTSGNPFFVQQLIRYFLEQNVIVKEDRGWELTTATLQLPETIQAILMARIDRLTSEVKDVVKTAAVIGQEFTLLLLSTILRKETLALARIVRDAQLWEEVQELFFIFKHALLRDAAYQMQLKERLRELHQIVAETMETLYAERSEKHYADLAYHYEQANLRDKAIAYLQKAGNEAKAQYHNAQALRLYDRLLSQLQSTFGFAEVEVDTLLQKTEILKLIGEWKTCQQLGEDTLQLAEQLGDPFRQGKAHRILGIISYHTGKYDDAMRYFEQARKLFTHVQDQDSLQNVLTLIGEVYRYKGDDDAAMTYYQQSLTICEAIGDEGGVAVNANNIGILFYEIRGDYDTAMTWWQKSLQHSHAPGQKMNKSNVLNNIGECLRAQGKYDAAMRHYEESLQLTEELGDRVNSAATLENIGQSYKAIGDVKRALTCYDRAIPILREARDKYFLCSCLINKADALLALQHYEDAQLSNSEGFQLAQTIKHPAYTFKGKLLSAQIAFAQGDQDAPQRLSDMLRHIKDESESAVLHYELWRMTQEESHRQAAHALYQSLYKHTPNIEYQQRVEEMREKT